MMSQSPDEIVTTRIVEKLRASELLSEARLREMRDKLLAGKLKAKDWERFAEFNTLTKETNRDGADLADPAAREDDSPFGKTRAEEVSRRDE